MPYLFAEEKKLEISLNHRVKNFVPAGIMEKKKVIRNAGAVFLQVVVSGVLMFILYRYLLVTIGVEKMGIWSMVLATTSASRFAELGLSGSVVKFVAKYISIKDFERAGKVVQTAAISLGLFVGVILVAGYYPLIWIFEQILPNGALPEAIAILPYALLSLWLTIIAGIFQSGLDGCQRIDLRSIFNILNSVLYLLLAMLLLPEFGLQGLAYVQVVMAGLLMFLSWFFLRRELIGMPYFPYRWNRLLFREMIFYGINIQFVSIVQMLFDPMTKALLSKFSTLSLVGYYDMASRMISQIQGLLSSPNQVLVPVIAGLHETEAGRITHIYKESYRLKLFLSLPVFAGIMAIIPAISQWWIGFYEPAFVSFSLLLAFGALLHGLTNPAYLCNLGIGRLKWNMLSQITIGTLNAILGVVLGVEFGGNGVVLAWAIALSVGSSLVILSFHNEHKIPVRNIFPSENLWLVLACTLGIGVSSYTYISLQPELSGLGLFIISSLGFAATIGIPLWRHPMRIQIFDMVRRL